ncbi:hypothetical protein GGR54DRAFT_651478 [Hypoxylon sp. NC1633]|nr:hypothetical protein GGR54DRAFT_651478 [Hypoxylon sp. NC1633]
MSNNEVNLDYVVLRTSTPRGLLAIRVLNAFVRPERHSLRRVSSDFDYTNFRKYLEDTLQIPTGLSLRALPSDRIVESEDTFWILLSATQSGVAAVETHAGLPVISFEYETIHPGHLEETPGPEPEESTPGPEPDTTLNLDPSDDIYGSTPPPRFQSQRESSRGDKGKAPGGPSDSDQGIAPGEPSGSGKGKEPERLPGADEGTAPEEPSGSGKGKEPERVPGTDKGKAREEQPAVDDERDILAEETVYDNDEAEEGQTLLDIHDEDSVDSGNGIIDGIKFDFANISDTTWGAVCRFFNCSTDTEEWRGAGFKFSLKNYQMHAVWFILTQATRGIPAALVGDDVGLGKTIMTIATTRLHHFIQVDYQAALAEWNAQPPPRDMDRQHLPREPQHLNDVTLVCPSQRGDHIQCSCVRSGDSYRVAFSIRPLPSIIVCPPDMIRQWANEVEKFISFTPGAQNMIYSAHHRAFDDMLHVKQFNADLVVPSRGDTVGLQNAGRSNRRARPVYKLTNQRTEIPQSQYVIIVSQRGAEALRQMYTHNDVSRLAASFVFFDEVHDYRGSRGKPTIPFQMLEKISTDSQHQVVAVGLSASILGGGPRNWRPFVDHMFRKSTAGRINIPGLGSVADLDHREVDWNYLIDRLGKEQDDRTRDLVATRYEGFKTFLGNFMPPLMLCRTKRGTFRGRPISDNPPRPIIERQCNLPEGPVRDAHRRCVGTVKSWVDAAFADHHRKWVEGGREGDEPNLGSFQLALLTGDNVGAGNYCRIYNVMVRSSTFPAIARLFEAKKINYEHLLRQHVEMESKLFTDAMQPRRTVAAARPSTPGRGTRAPSTPARRDTPGANAIGTLNRSVFYEFRHELAETSPKFQALCTWIDHILEQKATNYRWTEASGFPNPGPRPMDLTNLRHMLIFSDYQVSSLILLMLLLPKYENRAEFIYVHGGTTTKERAQLFQRLQAPCSMLDNPKILIATYKLAGKGHNLQRANYCMLTEVARTREIQWQAAGRIDRNGQNSIPITVQFYDTSNLAEMVRYNRSKARARLSDVGHDISLQDFM